MSLKKKISFKEYEDICYRLYLRQLPMYQFDVFLDICKSDRYEEEIGYSYKKGDVEY